VEHQLQIHFSVIQSAEVSCTTAQSLQPQLPFKQQTGTRFVEITIEAVCWKHIWLQRPLSVKLQKWKFCWTLLAQVSASTVVNSSTQWKTSTGTYTKVKVIKK